MPYRALLPAFTLVLVGACSDAPKVSAPAATPLAAAVDEFPSSFTGPLRAVELPGERLLVHNPRERRFVLLDGATGTQTEAVRFGDGPLEYRSGIRLVRAPGDSAWLFDHTRSRILLYSPQGEPVRTCPIPVGEGATARIAQPWLVSVARVVVLRDSSYVPELYLPDGTMRLADPIPYTPVPLTREAADRMLDSTARATGQMVARAMEGAGISAPRGLSALALPNPLPSQWPLFDENAVAVDFKDRLWVRVRTAAFDTSAVRYDVINREGRFVRGGGASAG
jgi:hypothetical protein